MAAAITAAALGLTVTVIDDQASVGGQIWRSVELSARRDAILGSSYTEGREIAQAFRQCGATYEPLKKLWQLERAKPEGGFKAYVSDGTRSEIFSAAAVILATGAQERPVPFSGWTLPGVMQVGAAQILLKNAGQIPSGPVWIAGSGPLPLLYIDQLVRAGGKIAGFLDTTPSGQLMSALRHLPRALAGWSDLAKGLGWSAKLRFASFPVIRGASHIEALGDDRLRALRYRDRNGASVSMPAECLLVHEGVVPNLHPALSLDCEIEWLEDQACFVPVLDEWGETSRPDLFIAGDGAGIGGAKAAGYRGELAAMRVAINKGLVLPDVSRAARLTRRKLSHALATRPFLDALFKPRSEIFSPADDAIICRCEEITAATIRQFSTVGLPGPNQLKAATRCGMGPCQGRQCGYTVTRILAATQSRSPAEVGYFHVRPPLKPVTLGELATLSDPTPT